jgi:chromosomal replication initiation ATPase DnaA
MDLDTIREEAAKHGCVVVSVRNTSISPTEVIRIACFATGIQVEDFFKRSRKQEIVFARYLAFYAFIRDNVMRQIDIDRRYGWNHSNIHYAEDLLRGVYEDEKNIKYFKEWQQFAILDFNAAYEEYKKTLKNDRVQKSCNEAV